ncbi:hypothetical protein COCNU_12G004510 [Cocos nucifera]|uniref:Ancestral coatomer element 1 Sec16/Sec31 domain-containing protein n=1 Tax=Cocos nucifera TaxID=13894 RepID=A0A8K0NAM9_COCNU|nr:hypothetical protein COCNU_12G004510 [Cocos nucifera]
MACIKSAPRSALVAFAPDAPYLAAGTMAGAVDLSFSSSANLEIFKLDFRSDAHELLVVGVCSSCERFNRLSWGKPGSGSDEYSLGLVAGGLGDGSIGVWNPLKLISSDNPDSALLSRLEKHTGPNAYTSGLKDAVLIPFFVMLHKPGVIAMSWCPSDSGFLLTCAKDNRTICWDTVTGEIVCELPASNSWNFDIQWYPKVPGVISASSFDVKIGIYNIEIVSAMVSNDLASLMSTRSLNLWKETLALLCTDLMEKTIVLAFATGHKRFSASLSKLIENYAELLASQGLLATAMEYLKLLGSVESSHELAILHDCIALSAEERETETYPYESSLRQANSMDALSNTLRRNRISVVDDFSSFTNGDKLQPQQKQSISGSPYGQGYQQPFGSSYGRYQPTQQKQQFQEYINPVPFQPAQSPQMFLPSQAPQPSYAPSPVSTQPAVKPFVPAMPPTLRNVEQYQQPTLDAQLYPGVASPANQSGPPGPGSSQAATVLGDRFAQVMAPNPALRSFMPVTTPGIVPRPGVSPVQPSSPTQPSQVQASVAPPAPPPTVQTVDTSNVPAELKPVVTTLTRLFNETSEARGGSRANPSKKREIEDNSRKIGSLFVKLNSGDISPNAASKLCQLCQALNSGDFVGALQIQVQLTTSDWEECSFWLGPVKRMIKTRQTEIKLNKPDCNFSIGTGPSFSSLEAAYLKGVVSRSEDRFQGW